jgi:hypothetical protein
MQLTLILTVSSTASVADTWGVPLTLEGWEGGVLAVKQALATMPFLDFFLDAAAFVSVKVCPNIDHTRRVCLRVARRRAELMNSKG